MPHLAAMCISSFNREPIRDAIHFAPRSSLPRKPRFRHPQPSLRRKPNSP